MKMFAIQTFVIATFCLATTLASTPFHACTHAPTPSELRIEGCEAEPCLFHRGNDVVAEWDFTVVSSTEDLKPRVFAKALGVTVPYPLPEQDACKSLMDSECPLDEGEEVTYGLKMPILKVYPKVSLLLEFALIDSHNNVHSCFKINAKVVN